MTIQCLILIHWLSIESSKGIYTIYPNCFPYFTTNIIPIDYPTINQPNKFCRSINLGDPIAVLGPIDFVSGSVDLNMPTLMRILLILGNLIAYSICEGKMKDGLKL